MRIAILDDDPAQLDLLQHTVKALGHDPHAFNNGQALMRALARDTFDMMVLDWELPDTTGITIVKWVRMQQGATFPILFVTQRSQESDIIEGLNAGADDYMIKPVRVAELIARLRAMLRRGYPQTGGVETFGEYKFDAGANLAEMNGERVDLKQKEFALALFMFRKAGRLVSRQQLRDEVWRSQADTDFRTVDVHMSRLRTKLRLRGEFGYQLVSVYSQGYRLEPVTLGSE
ncbi:response regulator transcription factor [Variovorax sp. VNK109]|uniref:response regulator transcription factor n=1 Tax=Variovorax sp. VNK109 TaxID=3400919 RepID=UPI003C04E524